MPPPFCAQRSHSILRRAGSRIAIAVALACAVGAAQAEDLPTDTACDPSAHDCANTLVPLEPKTGFIGGSHLGGSLRTFVDQQTIDGLIKRHAWTEDLQIDLQSGFTPGVVGVGADASLFAAWRVASSPNAGNMIHVDSSGASTDDRTWAYLGRYDVKLRAGESSVLKVGLLQVSNAFLESKDNRGLPPTFRGIAFTSTPTESLNVEAGRFNAVIARGHTDLASLTTNYGGIPFGNVTYVGANLNLAKDQTITVYQDQVQDVWNQTYVDLALASGDPANVRWSGNANAYFTRDTGGQMQGRIANNAYSLTLSATHGAFTGTVAYQRIASDQFFDYVGESWGIALANALVVDYVAPHEQSLQLRGVIDGRAFGLTGARLMLWATAGWGADASASAHAHEAADSPLHDLYWKNGQPVHGKHHEMGVYPSYIVQEGRFKGTRFSVFVVKHVATPFYSDNSSSEYKLTIETPLKAF